MNSSKRDVHLVGAYVPLLIKVKQPFLDRVDRHILASCETARSSPGAVHSFSPTLVEGRRSSMTVNSFSFDHLQRRMAFIALIDLEKTLIEFLSFRFIHFQIVERRRCRTKNVVHRSIDGISIHRWRSQRSTDRETTFPDRWPRFDMFLQQTSGSDGQRFEKIVFRLDLQLLLPLLKVTLIGERRFGEKGRELHHGIDQLFLLTRGKDRRRENRLDRQQTCPVWHDCWKVIY